MANQNMRFVDVEVGFTDPKLKFGYVKTVVAEKILFVGDNDCEPYVKSEMFEDFIFDKIFYDRLIGESGKKRKAKIRKLAADNPYEIIHITFYPPFGKTQVHYDI